MSISSHDLQLVTTVDVAALHSFWARKNQPGEPTVRQENGPPNGLPGGNKNRAVLEQTNTLEVQDQTKNGL